MTREEIQKEIDRLRALDRELEAKEQARYNTRAVQFVGKCYRKENKVFKIVEPLKRVYDGDFRWHYEKHRFIVLYLQYPRLPDEDDYWDDFTPVYYDELYFDITQFEAPYNCIEITQEEFNAEFDKCIAHFKEQINV